MDRRSFLTALTGGVAGLAIDPDMFGWVKHKSIFIPNPQLVELKHYVVDITFTEQDLFRGTMGFCGDVPIPLSAVDTNKMGPIFERFGNLYRIVELLPERHICWNNETIFAIPGGKLELLVRGSGPRLFSL